MKYVSRDQLVEAVRLLAGFRSKVNKQLAQHILPFLALRRKGVTTGDFTQYAESDDYAFFDRFLRVADDEFPYFDPIAGLRRIATHPHSNVATLRKGTFFRSWHAGTSDVDADKQERWRLEGDYLRIVRKRVLSKAGVTTRVPAIPLAAFLFRHEALPDTMDPAGLASRLFDELNLTTEERSLLFETDTTIASNFGASQLSKGDVLTALEEAGLIGGAREVRADFQELAIADDDPVLKEVRLLLQDGYAGVVFVGPPGTSKSWYAVQIALALAGDTLRVRKVQFHKSFQYEHFVEGFVPNEEGTGFELREQLMLQLIEDADANRSVQFVVMIDELSRSDPGRVFGELLTYMEPTRRDEAFLLASGREVSIPPNIVFVATMNSRDKSVQEIDDAFERRMAKIQFDPDPEILADFLRENGVEPEFARRVLAFFNWVNAVYPLGHTFFRSVKDQQSLRRLWDTQLRYAFDKQFKYEPDTVRQIREKFTEITGVSLA